MNISSEQTPAKAASPARTLTALFENQSLAKAAIARLVDSGISRKTIGLIADFKGSGPGSDEPEKEKGFFARLEDFIFPDDDRAVYHEAIRRGGYVVTVSDLSGDKYDLALDILDDEGTVDLDARAEQWRSEGETDTQAWLDRMTEHYEVISSEEAAEIVKQGKGDDVVPVITQKLSVGKRNYDSSRPRVRVYVVEHALKDTDDR